MGRKKRAGGTTSSAVKKARLKFTSETDESATHHRLKIKDFRTIHSGA